MIHVGWKRFTLLQFHRLQRHHDWNVQINIVIVVLSGQNKRERKKVAFANKGLELSIGNEQPLKDFRPRYKRGQWVQVNCMGLLIEIKMFWVDLNCLYSSESFSFVHILVVRKKLILNAKINRKCKFFFFLEKMNIFFFRKKNFFLILELSFIELIS